MNVSIVIPSHNEEQFIEHCLVSANRALQVAKGLEAELLVVLNRCTDRTGQIAEKNGARCVRFDEPCIAAIRNHGIKASHGELVFTIDADSVMHENTVQQAWGLYQSDASVGGDTGSTLERWSLGIVLSVMAMAPYLLRHRVRGGCFWFSREAFDAINGFDESLLSVEDVDFGKRLTAYGESQHREYRRLKGCRVVTSCRKFDQFGDWYLLRNPTLVRRIFSGKDRSAVDEFYYKTGRK